MKEHLSRLAERNRCSCLCPLLKLYHFEEVKWYVLMSCQKAAKTTEIDDFLDAQVIESLKVVPYDVFHGVAIVCRIKLDQPLAE